MNNFENPELQLAFDYVQYTNTHVFLTGKAGTGKTTFLHNLRKVSSKRMVILAPTGVAAINAGGVTIHSFFQLPFGPQVPVAYTGYGADSGRALQRETMVQYKFSREKINIIRSLDLLVIDEISMVRADLLDSLDTMLRRYRDRQKPFGGVQLLMIGDIQQLAPVVTTEDWKILRNYYDNLFFFSSRALQKTSYVSIELKHIYRQHDILFIDLLNRIRNNRADQETMKMLNKRYNPSFEPADEQGYIRLTTHNNKAQEINNNKLARLPEKAIVFKADIDGEFPEYAFPTESELHLKTDAQVMFVKNDISKEKQFFNGKIGRITGFNVEEETIFVKCPDDNFTISVNRMEWQNMKYSLDPETNEIQETVIGSFVQYPLKLAWSITIHKSQGLTFDRAIIDAQSAFAHGQVYVALSRCRTMEGLVLSTPVSGRSIISDAEVSRFSNEVEQNTPGQEQFNESKKAYQQMLITELFDFSPLQRLVLYCLKLEKENQQVVAGNLQTSLSNLNEVMKNDIIPVYTKFTMQVENLLNDNPDAEANEMLQERIGKACTYFADKLAVSIEGTLNNIDFASDNREVRKTIQQGLDKLQSEYGLKIACIQACREGFSIKRFLDACAMASIDRPTVKKNQSRTDTSYDTGKIKSTALFKKMLAWRAAKAAKLSIPAYMVLPQKVLLSIVSELPGSLRALAAIKGMGKKKVTRFGDDITAIVTACCKEDGLTPDAGEAPEKNPAPEKEDTKKVSLSLWRAGKSLEEIAAERNLVVTTIEGHLAHFVGTGEISINHFVTPEKIALISDFFLQQKTYALSPAKEALGEQVTYAELRFVLKHLESERKVII
jgi:hypothetical protein